ncbi:MAG: MbnP family protein, partial [Bacteroidota bacterium]
HAAGALGGDLDPTNGMYWTWQSGYINYKLEGFLSIEGKEQSFEFHLGGFRSPWATAFEVTFPCQEDNISLNFDPVLFFQSASTADGLKVMSPGSRAVELSRIFIDSFQVANP